MKNGMVRVLVFGGLVWPGAVSAQFGGPRDWDPNAERCGWLSSLDEGKARARRSGKPLMVVFRCLP